MTPFAARLRELITQRNTTYGAVGARVFASASTLRGYATGRRRPDLGTVARLDTALQADGELVRLAQVRVTAGAVDLPLMPGSLPSGEDIMRRRALMQSALAVVAGGAALGTLEAVRLQFAGLIPPPQATDRDVDEWTEIAWQHGETYLTAAPHEVTEGLAADFLELAGRIETERDPSRHRGLLRAGAQLAALMAMTLTNMGQLSPARRWWRTARAAADQSGDNAVRVWVRAEEGIKVLYSRRSPQAAIDLADEALSIGSMATVGKALACRAQALALTGDMTAATTAARAIEPAFAGMSAWVVNDERTAYGWSEQRLRHAESFTYAHAGATEPARTARERALTLTSYREPRSVALLHLHHALSLVHEGDADAGCRYAAATVTALPTAQRSQLVRQVAARVIDTVPASERTRPAVATLGEALAAQ